MKPYTLFQLIFLILISVCVQGFAIHNENNGSLNVREALARIPPEEQIILSCFFRTLVQEYSAGHVLYGSKPMCLTGYCNPWKNDANISPTSSLSFWTQSSVTFNKSNLMMEIGLLTWKKHEALFPTSNFALIDYQEEDGSVTILFINKKTLLTKIREESHELERFYRRKINAEDILNQILNRDPIFFMLFDKYHDMRGILLGYGSNNAKLFERKVQLWRGIGEIKFSGRVYKMPPAPGLTYRVIPSPGFNSLEEELLFLDKKTQSHERPSSNLSFAPRVGFIADMQDPETQKLKKAYSLERKEIAKIYANSNFLLTTLSRFIESDSEPENLKVQ